MFRESVPEDRGRIDPRTPSAMPLYDLDEVTAAQVGGSEERHRLLSFGRRTVLPSVLPAHCSSVSPRCLRQF
jgi:hypothetical protein